MVILCADCAASLLLPGRFAIPATDESGETIDVTVECMECGKQITARLENVGENALRLLRKAESDYILT